MQKLRVLAAVQTWAAAPVAALAGLSGFLLLAGGDGRVVLLTFVIAVASAVVASVGGVLWCLTGMQVHSPAPPGGRLARFGLRVLALVQIGSGGLLTAGAAVLASDGLLFRPRAERFDITPLVVLFVALGLAGSGAILWCLVRVAYPAARPR
jgi:hypothetical protein